MKLLLILLITNTLFGSDVFNANTKEIQIRGEAVDISSTCNNCTAQKNYLSLKKSDLEKIRKHIFGGRSWGDQACLKIFQARIVSSFDKDKNESHYCLFKDLSYISTDELSYLSMKLIK